MSFDADGEEGRLEGECLRSRTTSGLLDGMEVVAIGRGIARLRAEERSSELASRSVESQKREDTLTTTGETRCFLVDLSRKDAVSICNFSSVDIRVK